jgi:hypothetical protein
VEVFSLLEVPLDFRRGISSLRAITEEVSRISVARQAAEKPSRAVLSSGAKDLAVSIFNVMRGSSSRVLLQDNNVGELIRSLRVRGGVCRAVARNREIT